jgi:hypothetical protein
MLEKKDLLRINEMLILAIQGKARNGITPKDVPHIEPESVEMIALIELLNNPIVPELG